MIVIGRVLDARWTLTNVQLDLVQTMERVSIHTADMSAIVLPRGKVDTVKWTLTNVKEIHVYLFLYV